MKNGIQIKAVDELKVKIPFIAVLNFTNVFQKQVDWTIFHLLCVNE